jgi:hypothetical protein
MSIRFITAILAAAVAGSAFAQIPAPKPVKVGSFTITGTLRTRVEGWDWFKGSADNEYSYSGSLLRLGIGQQRRILDWQVEMAVPVLLGLPTSAIGPGAEGQYGLGGSYFAANDRSRNASLPFLKQAFVRFKALGGSEAHSIRIGRMEFMDGTEAIPKNATLAAVKRDRIAQRLIGNFGWTHVGRSLDGLHYAYNTPMNNVTLVAARPTRGVFQVDGWGGVNIGVFYGAFTRQVAAKNSVGELRLFGIYYNDWRDVLKTDNRPLPARRADAGQVRVGTAGAHYIHAFNTRAAVYDVLLWGALQTGAWGAQDHRAGAGDFEAGIQPAGWAWKPWLRAGFHYGSGDGNPNDGAHNTFFQILPTPRGYARLPFYNLMNTEDAFGQLILRPDRRLNIRSDIRWVRLSNANDLWYMGGGGFQPWTFGYVGRPSNGNRGMGRILDISAEYQMTPHVQLCGYVAHAQGKLVPQAIYPNGKNARLGYLELTYRF